MNKKITYVFSGERKKLISKEDKYAEEFFYGIKYFKNNNDVKIIEFNQNPSNNLILKFFDKVFQKALNLPFFSSFVTNKKNLEILKNTDYLILVNERAGLSSFFLILYVKIFGKINVTLFSMGLYSKKIRFKKLTILHDFFINIFTRVYDNIIFLGEGEYKRALKTSKNPNFYFVPFAIDHEFWQSNNKTRYQNEFIVFVGNDGNRNYELVYEIAKSMPQQKFIFISSNSLLNNNRLNNVTYIDGKWGTEKYNDYDIKELYEKSAVSIIPLKESYQPSGQSVCLQSMSLGIPVILSKTKGFWEEGKFENYKNIIFMNSNATVEDWISVISKLRTDKKLFELLSSNSKKTIKEHYNLDSFNKKIEKIIIKKV